MDISLVEHIVSVLERAGSGLTTGPGFAFALLTGALIWGLVYLVRQLRACEERKKTSDGQHDAEMAASFKRYEELLGRYEALIKERFEDYRTLLDLHGREKVQTRETMRVVKELTGRIEAAPSHGIVPQASARERDEPL